ncbi:ABC transporter ATP-binding protein [Protaetiibacter larvae]|uniref:ABC transporter ATP-binding protein n=1 Tax=Protaetiibacter larvae TaxID=2592654 RepID=UPI001FEAD70F|nr:ABC transporter ATP-binding protein [Protaetiibacter larvae]
MPVLEIQGLGVSFSTPYGAVDVLRDVSLSVERGEIAAIVGESGSGKSTLIRSVTGTVADNGRVRADKLVLGGRDLLSLSRSGYSRIRGRDIGFIPQDAQLGLNPLVPVGRLAEEPLRRTGVSRVERRRRVLELFDAVGLPDPERVYRSHAHELSGGMCQRVLIAAAISTKPQLIIADEPTSALDVTIQKRILDLLVELRDQIGSSIVLVTHDLGIAEERADRLHVLNRGELVESGTAEEILRAPKDRYTQLLLSTSSVGRLVLRDLPRSDADPAETPAAAPRPHLRVEALSKAFGARRRHQATLAVSNVTFDVRRSTTLGIVGESGSGKTTLLRILAGLVSPYEGTAEVDTGASLAGIGSREGREYLARRAQVVYQGSYASLDPRFTVAQLIDEPLTGFRLGDRRARRARIAELLERVHLPQSASGKYSSELSGGQRQRVAIARALAGEPELLLADEPVSALDVTVQGQIIALLRELQSELDLTMVFVSHDLSVVSDIADDILVLLHGQQVDYGPSGRVLRDTSIPYVRELVDAIPGGRLSRA